MSPLAEPRRDLDRYFAAARIHDPLPAAVERALARRYRATGDPKVAARLVLPHLRLVAKIVREHARGAAEADLVQEGNLGLLHAVRKFDPERGVRLCTYAAWWIRAYVLRAILNGYRLVRIGTTAASREAFFHLRKEKALLAQAGVDPDADRLGRRFGVDGGEMASLDQHLSAAEISLDETLVGQFLAGDDEQPDARCAREETRALVARHLATFQRELAPRDREILAARWLSDEPATLHEVGVRFGVTRERARQLERRVLGRFRRWLEKRLGRAAAAQLATAA